MILVTGATGLVGNALVRHLVADRTISDIAAASRRHDVSWPEGVRTTQVTQPLFAMDWSLSLQGVHVVIHCAARVHVMKQNSPDSLTEFGLINVDGTANLARQAAAAGVRRFVYLSSVKVNGESTNPGHPFTADDTPAPQGPYGISKHEAEQLLRQIAADTDMEIVIIRSPLVYGPRVKANFASMIRCLMHGMPLPLASITGNRRSLVAIDNLVDFLVTCINHPAAANQTFLVSDGEDLSTAEILIRMGDALGHPARLFHVSPELLQVGAMALNKANIYQRLCGSLQLDITKTRELLNWTPPISVEEGFRRTAYAFCR